MWMFVSRRSTALSREKWRGSPWMCREDTRTMHTEVDVPNPQRVLLPGLYADAELPLDRKDDVPTVPVQALNHEGDKTTVFVVNRDGELEDRAVQVGLQTASDAEITSGLSEGEQVVVSDRSGLKPGEKVHPQAVSRDAVPRGEHTVNSADRGRLTDHECDRTNFMPGFSIRNPYFIIVICLALLVIGVTSLARMPVDLFPPINLPEVVVATFYSGMPPEDIETDITDPLERFFTLASGVDHMESRSMLGVSIIRVYFQPGTNADADVSELSNLALADLKRLPPGTLPPVVLKFDASSLPVALVTVKGEGLNETQLHDYAQFQIRNQIAVVPGAEIPGVFGGIYRQIMVYVDPYKLQSRQLSVMDVVGAVNDSNLILPAGDVKMGPYDYFVYSNSLVDNMKQLGEVPLKVKGNSWVTVNDVGKAEDAHQIQYNIVRIDGQRSAYIPIMKQGGDTNTIAVVDGVRQLIKHLYDIPQQMKTSIVFDQSVYVKEAINTVLHEGFLGLILTSLMILIFLGSFRATSAVLLSIPLSALAAFVVLALMGGTVNTMILGGMALAFSRVIDNSVISLENIYRHLEMGAVPMVAAEVGGAEVNLAVLAATLVDVVDFFPVVFLYGVAKFLFSALALAFCLSLLASFVVAMTVIPLFCSRFLKAVPHGERHAEQGK